MDRINHNGNREQLVGQELLARPEFAEVFATTAALFGRIAIAAPAAEHFDLNSAAAAYDKQSKHRHEPRLVLAAVMSLDDVKSLYSSLTRDSEIPHNPLRTSVMKDEGLWISSYVEEQWGNLTVTTHDVAAIPGVTIDGRKWTLRAIPGANKVPLPPMSHKTTGYNDHPSISEYLTMQASLIQDGRYPIVSSEGAQTWLAGTLVGDHLAPVGQFRPENGTVQIGISDRNEQQSVRPAAPTKDYA